MIISQYTEEVQKYALGEFKDFYERGRGLRGTKLKNYTSGDHTAAGLESLFYNIAKRAIQVHGLEGIVEIDNAYHGDRKSKEIDPQRLDFSFKIDGVTFLIAESRAWIDKPFYTLKRAVVRNFMINHAHGIEGFAEELSPDVEFLFFALRADILPRLAKSQDRIMGFGERITMIDFSPMRRCSSKDPSKMYNYFDNGLVEENVKRFAEYLCDALKRKRDSYL